jgi:hypothetical protein
MIKTSTTISHTNQHTNKRINKQTEKEKGKKKNTISLKQTYNKKRYKLRKNMKYIIYLTQNGVKC